MLSLIGEKILQIYINVSKASLCIEMYKYLKYTKFRASCPDVTNRSLYKWLDGLRSSRDMLPSLPSTFVSNPLDFTLAWK